MPMQFGGKEEKVNLWGLASKLRLNKIREVIERGKEPTGEEIKFLVNMNHIVSELLKKNVVWNWEEQTEYYRLIKNPLLEGVRKAWLRSRADEHDKEQEEKRRMEQLANAIEQADVPAVRALVEQPFDPDYKVTVELNGKEETLYLGELVERLRLAKERAIVARGTKPTKEEIKFIVDISRILNVLSKHGVALELVSDEDYENFMRNPFLEDVRKARRQENFD